MTSSRLFLELVEAIFWISLFPISTDNILQFQSLKNANNIFLIMPIYNDFLLSPLTTFRNNSDAGRKESKLKENKLPSSGDEREQSGMHIEKWFITFQGDWFQKILNVCLLLIYRKTDSENFKWRDVRLPLLWYFKERKVVGDISCPIAHFSWCCGKYR